MLKANGIKKYMQKGLALMLSMLLLSSCVMSADIEKTKVETRDTKKAEYTGDNYHVVDTENMIFVTKSGLIELYFDTATYGIVIKETDTGKFWTSMPAKSEAHGENFSNVVLARLSKDGIIYELNSQDNAVAFSTAKFSALENGLKVTYHMALDAQTAESSAETDSPYVCVSVEYTLSDGSLHAKIRCAENQIAKGYVLESIDLLNYFGANQGAEENDFILLPDASGAILMTGIPHDDDITHRHFTVYGRDLSLPMDEKSKDVHADAVLGFYGMKQSDSAYVTLIQSGDTIATIDAYEQGENESFYRVGATFSVTDVYYNAEKGKQYVGNPYTGDIDLCFRFLSKKNADYSGMASACREQLIRNSVLSTKTVSESNHLPFALSLWGVASKNGGSSYATLSSFEQTQELLKMMKAKSINNVVLRYNGMLSGGQNPYLLSKSKTVPDLGNRKEFDALHQYMQTQQFQLYLNTGITTFNQRGTDSNRAVDITGKKIKITKENPFALLGGKETIVAETISPSAVKENVYDYVNHSKSYPVDGYAVQDAGRFLYSDYSSSTIQNRSTSAETLAKQVATLSSGHKLMVDVGNFYLLKNADFVSNLPWETSYPQGQNYKAVPFVEMILHGIMDYSLPAVNLAEDSNYEFLKALEYGALPAYSWYCSKTENEELDQIYHYEEQLNRAAENYVKADEILGNLRNARMTAHYEVEDGVYCTEYNNSIIIYFNYNDRARTVNSISVPAMSSLRIN